MSHAPKSILAILSSDTFERSLRGHAQAASLRDSRITPRSLSYSKADAQASAGGTNAEALAKAVLFVSAAYNHGGLSNTKPLDGFKPWIKSHGETLIDKSRRNPTAEGIVLFALALRDAVLATGPKAAAPTSTAADTDSTAADTSTAADVAADTAADSTAPELENVQHALAAITKERDEAREELAAAIKERDEAREELAAARAELEAIKAAAVKKPAPRRSTAKKPEAIEA